MTTSAPATNAPSPSGPPKAPVAAPRVILRTVARVGIVAGLFIGALVISWAIRSRLKPDPALDDMPPEMVKVTKMTEGGAPADLLARGDLALFNHRFADALSAYSELLDADGASVPLVDYRIGLCNESLGQNPKAIAHYRQAISASSTSPLACASQLGIARCLLRQNENAAVRRMVSPILLDESSQRGFPPAFVADARYLLALAFARETHPPTADPLALDRLGIAADARLSHSFYLEETAKTVEPMSKIEPGAKPMPIVVKKRTEKQPALVQRIERANRPARELLDQLAAEGGLHSEWTAPALMKVIDRTLTLDVRDQHLQDVVETAADGFELICHWEKNVVRFSAREEVDAAKDLVRRRQVAQRALHAAGRADPAHRLSAAALLELGNAEAAEGKFAEASRWYERVVNDTRSNPFVVLAYANHAELQRRQQLWPDARKGYFRVIDQAPGHEQALRAHLRLGQLCLEEENPKDAVQHLRRTQTIGPNSPCHSLATLHLAAAWLSLGQADKARATLESQRQALQQEPFKPTAAILDSYARYKLAKATDYSRREASDLLSTLWHYQDATVLGAFGKCLLAQAYDDLGFWDHAERSLRQAVAPPQSRLAGSIELKLGEILLKRNQRGKAQEQFVKVAATKSPHQGRALFHLARIDLQESRWPECAAKCRALWQAQSFPEPLALLQLWGTALESAGDYTGAAKCFDGKAPD